MIEFMNVVSNIGHLLIRSSIPVGVVIYAAQKFIVPQILEYRELIKRARYDVIYFANVYPIRDTMTGEIINSGALDDASKEFRVISSRLRAHRDNLIFYGMWSAMGLLPLWKTVETVAVNFIGWSNEVYENGPNSGRQIFRKNIAKALGMNP